ncbi:hypothetical protein Tco_0496626 [Tanacetum coccineum]
MPLFLPCAFAVARLPVAPVYGVAVRSLGEGGSNEGLASDGGEVAVESGNYEGCGLFLVPHHVLGLGEAGRRGRCEASCDPFAGVTSIDWLLLGEVAEGVVGGREVRTAEAFMNSWSADKTHVSARDCNSKESCFTSDSVKPKVLAPGMYAIDVKPIPHPLKNNRSAHLNYISHLKESVETVREIVEEARVVKPLDNALNYACQYTKLSQELLEYELHLATHRNTSTEASGSKPRSNTKKNRILPAKRENEKKVEDHLRTNKSVWTKVNRVDSSISYRHVVINSNSESVCKMCNKCLNSANHEMCVVNILSSVNATPTVKIVLNKGKQIWKPKGKLSDNRLNMTKRVWKATGKLFADIGCQWRPTGKKFTLGKLDCGYQWRPTRG